MPEHSHGIKTYKEEKKQTGTSTKCWSGQENTQTEKTGGNEHHNNMQPFFVVNYIIYAGKINE